MSYINFRSFSENSDYEDSDAMFKVNGFPTGSSVTSLKISILTAMDEINTVITETCQFQCLLESKLTAFLRISRTVRSLTQRPNPTNFQGIGLPLFENFQLIP